MKFPKVPMLASASESGGSDDSDVGAAVDDPDGEVGSWDDARCLKK